MSTPTPTIERIWDLADRSARARSKGDDCQNYEDLRQEGAIGGWLAVQVEPDASEAYVQRAIINQMNDWLGGTTTGSERNNRQGGGRLVLAASTSLQGLEERGVGMPEPAVRDTYPSDAGPEHPIWRLVEGLPSPKREILTLTYRDGLNPEAVRQELGMTKQQVNIHHRWAMHRLRKESARALTTTTTTTTTQED